MPKPFTLHVGLQRCASTMIESTFLKPEHPVCQALHSAGVRTLMDQYLYMSERRDDHHWTDEFIDDLRARYFEPLITDETARGYFLTEEGLSVTWRETDGGIDVKARAQHLVRLLDGFEPSIILIVRDQASFVRSLYALHLQNLGTLAKEAFVESIPDDALDWHKLAGIYADAFGKDRLTVLPYNNGCYGADAPHQDFVPALQACAGLETPVPVPRTQLYNPSLMGAFFGIQLAANQSLPENAATDLMKLLRVARERAVPNAVIKVIRDEHGTEVAKTLRDLYAAARSQKHGGFEDDTQRTYLARFEASNRALFEDFMPAYDPAPFLPAS